MKIVVISGDPSKQEALIEQLLKESVNNDQTVHLHNSLHSEMQTVTKVHPLEAKSERDVLRLYNECYGLCLTTKYEAPFIGHTIGFSYGRFSTKQKELLNELVKLTVIPEMNGYNHYTQLIRGVKDIKYVDTLLIYNVIDVKALRNSIENYVGNYGNRSSNIYWFNFKTDSCFNNLTKELIDDITSMSKVTLVTDVGDSLNSLVKAVIDSGSIEEKSEQKKQVDPPIDDVLPSPVNMEHTNGELPTPEPAYRYRTLTEPTYRNFVDNLQRTGFYNVGHTN